MEGLLKKVKSGQVIVTPNPQTKIKLDELNSILNEMKQGETAVKRLQELDSSRGLQDPVDVAKRMRGDKQVPPPINQAPEGILGDSSLAQQRLQQAQRMAAEARGLLAESERLTAEAHQMDPSLAPKKAKATKKAQVTEAVVEAPAPKVRKARTKVSV